RRASRLPFMNVPANHGSSGPTTPIADGLVNTGARNRLANATSAARVEASLGHWAPTTTTGRPALSTNPRTPAVRRTDAEASLDHVTASVTSAAPGSTPTSPRQTRPGPIGSPIPPARPATPGPTPLAATPAPPPALGEAEASAANDWST